MKRKAIEDEDLSVEERNLRRSIRLAKLENELSELTSKTKENNAKGAHADMREDMWSVSCGKKEGVTNDELRDYFKAR
jgi:hypothetical protein